MFAGVGERTREGNDLYHEMQTTKVIQLNGASKAGKHQLQVVIDRLAVEAEIAPFTQLTLVFACSALQR